MRNCVAWAGSRAAKTKAAEVGDMMLSMLRGEEGRFLDRLLECVNCDPWHPFIQWMQADGKWDAQLNRPVAVKMLLWFVLLLHAAPVMVWVERRGAAMIQDRPGPNRLGPLGLFQAIADVLGYRNVDRTPPDRVTSAAKTPHIRTAGTASPPR